MNEKKKMKRIALPFSSWLLTKGKDTPSTHNEVACNAIVVGSGYGGSVAALRLAEKGYNVTLLERGSEFLPGEFPNDFGLTPAYFRAPSLNGRTVMGSANGLFELRAGPGAASIVANGVGGGSLINAGVLMQPKDEVLRQQVWPRGIRQEDAPLARYFEKVKEELPNHDTRSSNTPKSLAFERLLDSNRKNGGFGCCSNKPDTRASKIDSVNVTVDEDKCTGCGDCVSGCNVEGAKSTLLDTYLRKAFEHKAHPIEIISCATVYTLERTDSEAWSLRVLPTEKVSHYRSFDALARDKTEGATLIADLVVLAAGAFGSTEILQRSAAKAGRDLSLSPALGSRFSANGDNVSFSMNEEIPVQAIGHGARGNPPEIGTTITRMLDLRRHDPFNGRERPSLERQIVIQNGSVPGAIEHLAGAIVGTSLVSSQLGNFRWSYPFKDTVDHLISGHSTHKCDGDSPMQRMQVFLTMGHDGSQGRMLWVPGRDSSVPYWDDPEDVETYAHQEKVLNALCSANGSRWVPNPLWQLLPKRLAALMSGPKIAKTILTVHPLGGCVMGDDPNRSVVNEYGQVWCYEADNEDARDLYPDLYVLDGSILPSSLGCNPLLTIAALAERAVKTIPALVSPVRIPKQAFVVEPAPKAMQKASNQALPVRMEERLTAFDLPIQNAAGTALEAYSGRSVDADLSLRFETSDWLAMWNDINHSFDIKGHLAVSDDTQNTTVFHVLSDSKAHIFVDSEHAIRNRPFLRFLRRVPVVIRVGLTYFIKRWKDLDFHSNLAAIPETAAYLWHATESRLVRYEFKLGLDEHGPTSLNLFGDKSISYAATWREIGCYAVRVLRSKFGNEQSQPIQLRESIIEQASHLFVTINDIKSGKQLVKRRFLMDFSELVEKIPMRLTGCGDLPGAMVKLAEYPLFLGRFFLKTAIYEFRLPDYSNVPVADVSADSETKLRCGVKPLKFDLCVPLGRSSQDFDADSNSKLKLRMWRYKQPDLRPRNDRWHGQDVVKVRSVLLVHAFAQSGYSFTHKTTDTNLAEHLFQAGFDVWILEHRLSTRLPAHEELTTIDQIAEHDIPAAVDKMIEEIARDLNASATPRPEELRGKLQVFVFAQCLGAASTTMSLLSGRLAHSSGDGNGPESAPPKIAGLIVSQTHPHCVGQPLTRARTWLPAFLRDTAKLTTIPLVVREKPTTAEAFLDRIFAALPIPESELCPKTHSKRDHEDDCATCRRLRFIEAPMFAHKNLNYETHRELNRLFGNANVRVFAQAAKCVEAERLVNEDGENIYVTDSNMSKHFGLPVVFLHGADNQLFDAESARRSAKHYERVQPEWAGRAKEALNCGTGNEANDGTAWIVEGYGHVDVLLGKHSADDVFPRIAKVFDYWHKSDHSKGCESPKTTCADTMHVIARVPGSGPFIGSLSRCDDRALRVTVSFRIDDRFSDSKDNDRTWTVARVRPRDTSAEVADDVSGKGCVGIQLLELKTPDCFPSGRQHPYRFRWAVGEVVIPEKMLDKIGSEFFIECLSIHETVHGDDHGDSIEVATDALSAAGFFDHAFMDKLVKSIEGRFERLAAAMGPRRRSASHLDRFRETIDWSRARLSTHSINALAPRKDETAAKSVVFAIGSCRYPGFRIEHRRVDNWIALSSDEQLDFSLLVGDQIYADVTAGFADELNVNERFVERHRFAFNRSRSSAEHASFGDWLTQRPTFMVPDDHEFIDAYPNGPPFWKSYREDGAAGEESDSGCVEKSVADAARTALHAFQHLQIQRKKNESYDGVWALQAGPARILLLDTRSDRTRTAILTQLQCKRIESWLGDDEAKKYLNIIVTGSVVFPGVQDRANPSNPGRQDNFQSDRVQRKFLAEQIKKQHDKAKDSFRVLFVSGDYHLSAVSSIFDDQEKLIGAAVTAPGLYAPMPFANGSKQDLLAYENLGGLKFITPLETVTQAVGLGIVKVERIADAEGRQYEISFKTNVWDVNQLGEQDTGICLRF